MMRITKEEVVFAIKKLKTRKAAGPDLLIGEMYKHSNDQVINFFVKFFNALFDKGIFPQNWTESVILPLFKKGEVNDPNNYRGISLCDISGKIFSSIINSRLQEWVRENNITGDHQAGFKKGYSTIDHLFALMASVQKQLSSKRKLYVAFIDFEKAFDSINRHILWPILLNNGIKGKLFNCILSMYESVKCRVKCGSQFTDFINCSVGVKQGDVCSPVLFSLLINELALEVINNGRHGVIFPLDAFELFILLLADDVILLSETIVGLQNQLNNLHRAASSLHLKVNMKKSNIIVFRKGGYLKSRETWMYDTISMPVVNAYKYLGIFFTTRLSFVSACKDLASRGKRSLLCIMKSLSSINNASLKLFTKIFDSHVQPVVQYGSEIWGMTQAAIHCESVHLFALKRFLGLDMRTPNDLVYGETNRYPIVINSIVQCLRYWFKLLNMDRSRIPHKAYRMLFDLDSRGKTNWVSDVRLCLFRYGFGEVWLNQGVGSEINFIKQFRQRLIECRWQDWNNHIETSERFSMYRIFSNNHEVKPYLFFNLDRYLKIITTRFRLGVSTLAVHQHRYKVTPDDSLVCPLCRTSKEDEMHFVLCCPALQDIRIKYIQPKYYRHPCIFKLCLLMASTKQSDVLNLALFLEKAFKHRDIVTS